MKKLFLILLTVVIGMYTLPAKATVSCACANGRTIFADDSSLCRECCQQEGSEYLG